MSVPKRIQIRRTRRVLLDGICAAVLALLAIIALAELAGACERNLRPGNSPPCGCTVHPGTPSDPEVRPGGVRFFPTMIGKDHNTENKKLS